MMERKKHSNLVYNNLTGTVTHNAEHNGLIHYNIINYFKKFLGLLY